MTTVSQPLATDLGADFGVRVEVVQNGYDPITVKDYDVRVPLSHARLNILYVGNSFYDGRRTPAPLLRAAGSLGLNARDVQIHFLGSDSEFVRSTAAEAGVADLVRVLPPVPRAESLQLQSRADALLLLLWNDFGEAGTYSGKIFEYVAARRPIVMTGYPHGVAAQLILRHQIGAVVNSEQEATQWLEGALRSKSSPALLPDLDAAMTSDLSRASQNSKMERLLRRAATSRQGFLSDCR